MPSSAAPITWDAHEIDIFQKSLRSQTHGKNLLTRVSIVLAASEQSSTKSLK